jgi:hypothetical protein
MLHKSELRRVEVFNGEKWVKVQSIGQIEKGDVFRMFEGDDTPVKNEVGNYSFIALAPSSILAESLP